MSRKPNLIIIICDDLGYGDLACHGNPYIKTPNLDRLHQESSHLLRYCSGPLCSPARASLMTGRYHYRTGVVDTYIGRSMMHPDETTMAQVFAKGGYRTGIFGKWHLGDNYPLRAIDQGFQEALVHNGGGIGQPGDYEGNTYQNPTLYHNGIPEPYQGYCADVFTTALLEWVYQAPQEPFFAYLAFNTPHSPLQVADELVKPYLDLGLPEATARIYAMETNIDLNVGRVMATLAELGLAEDTILMFTSDHGPCGSSRPADWDQEGYVINQFRYNADLRGYKGSLYEGGIRVPCFIRWPGQFQANVDLDRIASPIDILPTMASACGLDMPDNLDGWDLTPLLRESGEQGEAPEAADDWPRRTIFVQWHRGDFPEQWRNCAVIRQRYKLINGEELYDLETDASETSNIITEHPNLVAQMQADYEAWFEDVSATRGYDPPRIIVGSEYENPSVLTRQDWRGSEREFWSDDDVGFWEIDLVSPGPYTVRLRFAPLNSLGQVLLRFGSTQVAAGLEPGQGDYTFQNLNFIPGSGQFEAWILDGEAKKGVRYVDLKQI